MKVYLERFKNYKEAQGKTILELLKYLKINPQDVIVTKNDKLTIEETKISEKDEIVIYHFVSAG